MMARTQPGDDTIEDAGNMMLDDILKQAQAMAMDPEAGPQEAAKFLGSHRQHFAQRLKEDRHAILPLVAIVADQLDYLVTSGNDAMAASVSEWFLHTLHHVEPFPGKFPHEAFREPLARLFRRYAKALKVLGRYDEMRLAMRSSLDATAHLPMAVLFLLHLYGDLPKLTDAIEGEPVCVWLSKRYAECLAALDFAGYSDTPFRHALDDYQLAFRSPARRQEIFQRFSQDASASEDVQTLRNLFARHFMDAPASESTCP
ncbi:MAG: hypothetical protein FWC40_06145 [Proteobacteria bacterium]|nr:hypothetical protein [Pseudomonadota bacterium]